MSIIEMIIPAVLLAIFIALVGVTAYYWGKPETFDWRAQRQYMPDRNLKLTDADIRRVMEANDRLRAASTATSITAAEATSGIGTQS
jgi:hypothetical protein